MGSEGMVIASVENGDRQKTPTKNSRTTDVIFLSRFIPILYYLLGWVWREGGDNRDYNKPILFKIFL